MTTIQLTASASIGLRPTTRPLKFGTDLAQYNIISATVRRGAGDSTWELQAEIHGSDSPREFTHVRLDAIDRTGTTRHIFSGIITKTERKKSGTGIRTTVTAYDYGWYLSAQYLAIQDLTVNLAGSYTTWQAWITHLLAETGLTAYDVRSSSADAKEMTYQAGTSKLQVIQDITEHCEFVFLTTWRDDAGFEPVVRWVPAASIADLGGAPASITADEWVVEIPALYNVQDDKINRVRIRGRNSSGTWYSKTLQTAAVTAGDDLPREYYKESSAWNTQGKVDAAASAAYTYFTHPPWVITVVLYQRYDLQLHQLIQFTGTGWPDYIKKMTDGTLGYSYMRITDIEYQVAKGQPYVTITAISHSAVTLQMSRMRNMTCDLVSEIETIVDAAVSNLPSAEVGTVTDVDGDQITVELEKGNTITARAIGTAPEVGSSVVCEPLGGEYITYGNGTGGGGGGGTTDHSELDNLAWSVAGHSIDTDLDMAGNDILSSTGDMTIDVNGDLTLAASGDVKAGTDIDLNGNLLKNTAGDLGLTANGDVILGVDLDANGHAIKDDAGNLNLNAATGYIIRANKNVDLYGNTLYSSLGNTVIQASSGNNVKFRIPSGKAIIYETI